MQARFARCQLRLRLGDVGRRHLPGVEAVARVLEGALQDANIVLLHLEIGGIARDVHVGGRGRQQHRLLHHAQRLPRLRDLAFGGAHPVRGLLTVEQGLVAGDAEGGDCVGAREWYRNALR